MSAKLIQDNWPERIIQIASGEKIKLIADDPDDLSRVSAVNSKNQEIGEIGFFRFEDNPQSGDLLLINSLALDKLGASYTRQGIGEAILQIVKDNCELPIVATCPLATTERNDGSHLTGRGPNFVRKMRELKLIEEGCVGDCLCGPDSYADDYGGGDDE